MTVKWHAEVFEFESLPSTNDEARQLIKSNQARNGTLIYTPNQTQGRGQRSTKWVSEPGSALTFSLVLYPGFLEATRQFHLTQAVSLGIFEALHSVIDQDGLAIKWPNDIYWKHYKMGGILIENSLSGNSIAYSIVGIGLNLNQAGFPDDLANPISLHQITGQTFDPKAIMNKLTEGIKGYFGMLEEGAMKALKCEYENVLYLKDTFHDFKLEDGRNYSGKILGVDAFGYLIVESSDGTQNSFDFKQVKF